MQIYIKSRSIHRELFGELGFILYYTSLGLVKSNTIE